MRIRIQRIGVCGSDIHVFHGKHPFVTYPLIQGHEYAGVIDVVGEGVAGIEIGDQVTATPQEVCGACPPCQTRTVQRLRGIESTWFPGAGLCAGLFRHRGGQDHQASGRLSPEQGAFVEPVAVAVHSTGRAGDLTGKNVVVSGAGTIGNFVAQACKCRGAAKVLIADVSDYRLQVAKSVGVDAVCNVTEEPLADAARRVFGERGFEVGAEVAGVEPSLSALTAGIGKGGTLLIVGVFGDKPAVDMSVVCEHELTLKGSMMYRHEDFEQAVEWIASGEVQTDPLVSKHFAFEDFDKAYAFIDAEGDKAMKVMIDLQ